MSQLEDKTYPEWKPSQKEEELVRKLQDKFSKARIARETPYRLLNNRSLEQYWEDSEQRWISYVPGQRKKPWQAKIVKPVTRNRCIGIIANLLERLIKPDITAQLKGQIVDDVSKAVKDLLEISHDKEQYTLKYLMALIDAVSLGTAFVQEDYVLEKRKVKEVKSWNPLNNDIETEEKDIFDYEGFRMSVVSPYEIYLGNIFEYDIQKQPFIFRRLVIPYSEANTRFGGYDNFEHVQPGMDNTTAEDEEDSRFYQPYIQRDIEDDEVEVLYYWSRPDDQTAIIANGILLTDPDFPIPYAHKNYPLAKTAFEPLSPRFAYGKSLPDKLKGEQDVVDTLYRMVIDKTFLSIFPPMLARGSEKLTSDIVVPGRITNVDSETEVSPPDAVANGVGNEINLISFIENSMSRSSIDPRHTGTPAGGERTATQVMETKRGAEKILGLFGFMIAFLIEDVTKLRVQNILQFWAREKRKVLNDGDLEAVNSVFQVDEAELRDDSMGIRQIEFIPSNQQPDPRTIFKLEKIFEKREGKKINRIIIDPHKIRDYNFIVKVKANPTQRISPELRKALGLEFYDRFIQNPHINPRKLTTDAIKLFDKNPDELLRQQQQTRPQGPGAPSRPNTQRQGNLSSQLAAAAQPSLQGMLTQE